MYERNGKKSGDHNIFNLLDSELQVFCSSGLTSATLAIALSAEGDDINSTISFGGFLAPGYLSYKSIDIFRCMKGTKICTPFLGANK